MKLATKFTSAVLALSLSVGGFALSASYASVAMAQTTSSKAIVDQAKTDNLVGERIDGYLALVNANAPAHVQAAVNEINIRRKSVYTKLARSGGTEVAVIARLSGEKLIAKAAPSTKIMGDDGVWRTR